MGKFDNAGFVELNDEQFAIVPFKFKGKSYPVVLDYMMYKIINKMNKSWYVNDRGFLYTKHKRDGKSIDIYLHDLVKNLQSKIDETDPKSKPIIHINRIPFDNRTDNLQYDICDKGCNKNLRKKKRTVKLPKGCGINSSELPTYIWFLKSDGQHGDRFFVSVDDVKWKGTSSNKVSLRYKFEEAKKYLRNLQNKRPDIFSKYSMNGDFNKRGNELLADYYAISQAGGYKGFKYAQMDKNTEIFLEEDGKGLNQFEKMALAKFDPSKSLLNINNEYKEYRDNKLKKYIDKMPEYCNYVDSTAKCGDYFYIKNHPKCKNKWCTTKDNGVSTRDKFMELISKLKDL
jgi:hypothetical protein